MELVWQAEDSLRENKVENDLKDLLKTLVAFANSVAPGDTAKIFIAERDDGTVQGVTDTDYIQKTVKKEADKIYPEIYYRTEAYDRDGKQCVRVDAKHNGLAPHFGGPGWVRRGSETIEATEELYEQMVALKNSKIQILAKWLNKMVTVEGTGKRKAFERGNLSAFLAQEWSVGAHQATLVAVNMHWVTFNVHISDNHKVDRSEPLEKLMLSWDDERQRLKVLVWNLS